MSPLRLSEFEIYENRDIANSSKRNLSTICSSQSKKIQDSKISPISELKGNDFKKLWKAEEYYQIGGSFIPI